MTIGVTRGVIVCAFFSMNVSAGHGLMNSFAGIEWLPSPGLTPESWRYRTDSWQESVLLWRAKSPLDEVTISERIAREKLAELEAMIRAGNLAAAEISIDHYRHYIQHAEAALAKVAPQASADVTLKFATALLEHQFIITSDYLDLPRDSRRVAAGMIETAAKAYANLRAQLPRRIQESLFFKEEEVRWSRQQAEGADAQGL